MGLIISLFSFKVPSYSIRVNQAARAFAEQVLIKLFYYTQVLAFFFISPDLIAAGNGTIAQTVQMVTLMRAVAPFSNGSRHAVTPALNGNKQMFGTRKPYRDPSFSSPHVSAHQSSLHSSGTHRGHLLGQPLPATKFEIKKNRRSFNKRLSGAPATRPSPENVIDKKKYDEPQFIQIKKKNQARVTKQLIRRFGKKVVSEKIKDNPAQRSTTSTDSGEPVKQTSPSLLSGQMGDDKPVVAGNQAPAPDKVSGAARIAARQRQAKKTDYMRWIVPNAPSYAKEKSVTAKPFHKVSIPREVFTGHCSQCSDTHSGQFIQADNQPLSFHVFRESGAVLLSSHEIYVNPEQGMVGLEVKVRKFRDAPGSYQADTAFGEKGTFACSAAVDPADTVQSSAVTESAAVVLLCRKGETEAHRGIVFDLTGTKVDNDIALKGRFFRFFDNMLYTLSSQSPTLHIYPDVTGTGQVSGAPALPRTYNLQALLHNEEKLISALRVGDDLLAIVRADGQTSMAVYLLDSSSQIQSEVRIPCQSGKHYQLIFNGEVPVLVATPQNPIEQAIGLSGKSSIVRNLFLQTLHDAVHSASLDIFVDGVTKSHLKRSKRTRRSKDSLCEQEVSGAYSFNCTNRHFDNCTSNIPETQERVIYMGTGTCVDAHTQMNCTFHTRREAFAENPGEPLSEHRIDKIDCQRCQAEADETYADGQFAGNYRFIPAGCLTASLNKGTFGAECLDGAKANFHYACQDRKVSACCSHGFGFFEGNGTCQSEKAGECQFTALRPHSIGISEGFSDLVSCQNCIANFSSTSFDSQTANDCTPFECIGGCPRHSSSGVGIAAGSVTGAVLLIATPVGLFIYCKYCNGWSCVKRVGKRHTYEPIQ